MKRIVKLKQDYKVDRVAQKDAPKDEQITINTLSYVVQLGYGQGLNADKRRIYNTLMDLMEEAVEKGIDLSINYYQYLFLKEAFDKALVPAGNVKMVSVAEKALLDAKEEEEEKSAKK